MNYKREAGISGFPFISLPVSLWEILAENSAFPFPDYHGMEMSIHDACPTRDQARVHSAIRRLLEKMSMAAWILAGFPAGRF
jgi:Fe-S oxidoreductase